MQEFTNKIYHWYEKNKRNLPWRNVDDPYQIWISEIILQQTRVAQGITFFNNFISCFPNVKKLASASEDEVLKQWQGLGYYSRARNLHFTARQIQKEFNGNFPSNYKNILALKGIGKYTAAAIASIAYGLPYPAVDGNVIRVLSRYFGYTDNVDSAKGKKEIEQIAAEIMETKNPGMHNQAIMEFGALVCTPKSPKCLSCSVNETCFANLNNLQNQIPVRNIKSTQTIRHFTYFYIDAGKHTFIEKRSKNDIWKNLYQFPLLETPQELTITEIANHEYFKRELNSPAITFISKIKKHVLSHQIIFARLVKVEPQNNPGNFNPKFIQINKKDIFTFAVPKLLERFIDELQ